MEKRSTAAPGIEWETSAGFRIPCRPAAKLLESTRVSHSHPMPAATPDQITAIPATLKALGHIA